MAGFYEKSREDNRSVYISRNRRRIYPAHFHQNLEIFIARKGTYVISVNGHRLNVSDGMVVLIDSYDVHEYVECDAEDDCAVVIPYRYLDQFNAARGGRTFAENIIDDAALSNELLEITDKYASSTSEYTRDAAVQLILSRILDHVRLSDEPARAEAELARKILIYIQQK